MMLLQGPNGPTKSFQQFVEGTRPTLAHLAATLRWTVPIRETVHLTATLGWTVPLRTPVAADWMARWQGPNGTTKSFQLFVEGTGLQDVMATSGVKGTHVSLSSPEP